MSPKHPRPHGTTRGFAQTASLLAPRIRAAAEGRGFAVTRLLTHWAEIVGEAIAAAARPVNVSYGRDGFGATLTCECAAQVVVGTGGLWLQCCKTPGLMQQGGPCWAASRLLC